MLFALLNGESFDYIGSSRMAYDMQKDQFPSKIDNSTTDDGEETVNWPNIDLKSLYGHIELGQLAIHKGNIDLFAHQDESSPAQELISKLKQSAKNYNLRLADSSIQRLPPSSIQPLLKKEPSVPGNFEKKFREIGTQFNRIVFVL